MRTVMGLLWCGVIALAGCQAGGESWAEGKLKKSGAELIRQEALAAIGARMYPPDPIELGQVRCPSPRVVLDLFPTQSAAPRLEYSRVSGKIPGASMIKGESDVRCLVLVSHDAKGARRNFKEWMFVSFVDRESHVEQVVQLDGNDPELIKALSSL